jgi:hypothetical protein
MGKRNRQKLNKNTHKSIEAPVLPQTERVGLALMFLAGVLIAYRFLVFPLSPTESTAQWIAFSAALVLSVAFLVYGRNRRHFWISLLIAAASLAAGVWELRPAEGVPRWAGLVVGGSNGVGLVAWLVFVLPGRSRIRRAPGGSSSGLNARRTS